jgi:hypothetical protein
VMKSRRRICTHPPSREGAHAIRPHVADIRLPCLDPFGSCGSLPPWLGQVLVPCRRRAVSNPQRHAIRAALIVAPDALATLAEPFGAAAPLGVSPIELCHRERSSKMEVRKPLRDCICQGLFISLKQVTPQTSWGRVRKEDKVDFGRQ